MPRIEPVQTRSEQVADQLRDRIAAGEFPVGSLIPTEKDLAEETGVSRNSVREAVRALVHAGMLASRAGSLRRDAAVDRTLVDAVRAGCADPDPEVRASAASALGALARPEDLESALPVLTGMVMDVDADLAAAAELALEQLAIRLDRPGLRVSLEG